MSTPSDSPAPANVGDDRRLHPLSLLFALLQQLRAFAVPLAVLLVTGRGSGAVWIGLGSIAVLTLVAIAQYLTYRYRMDADGIVIRSGVLQRTRRDIPYERIHTVNLHQTLLHRLAGVTDVRLESAGSKEAEAVMRVLSITEARAIEGIIRERGQARRQDPHDAVALEADSDVPLLTLDTAEIVRLGLISNRGMVVVAAIVGLAWQFVDEDRITSEYALGAIAFMRSTGDRLFERLHDTASLAIAGTLLLSALVVFVRVLSVSLALLQFHGFTLTEAGRQLRVERGLLSRIRNQLPRRRIQAWRIDETLLHRWFGRQTLRVDSAAGGEGEHGVRHLAPVATPDNVRTLIGHLRPDDGWPPPEWLPLHPRAWRRLFVVPSLLVATAAALLALRYGPVGLTLLAFLPLLVVRARRLARFSGYAVTPRSIAVRWGWLNRRWGLVDIRKLQALRVTQSPLDRRHGMATIWFDTAGAGAADGVLRIPYLPADEARSLHDRLAGLMDAERT